MNAFLWTMIAIGLIELGGTTAYLSVGRIPERTKAGIVINCIAWVGISLWAVSLLGKS